MLIGDDEQTCTVLTEVSYLIKLTLVLAVEISERVNEQAGLLAEMEKTNLHIDYFYSTRNGSARQSIIVLNTKNLSKLESVPVSRRYRTKQIEELYHDTYFLVHQEITLIIHTPN